MFFDPQLQNKTTLRFLIGPKLFSEKLIFCSKNQRFFTFWGLYKRFEKDFIELHLVKINTSHVSKDKKTCTRHWDILRRRSSSSAAWTASRCATRWPRRRRSPARSPTGYSSAVETHRPPLQKIPSGEIRYGEYRFVEYKNVYEAPRGAAPYRVSACAL